MGSYNQRLRDRDSGRLQSLTQRQGQWEVTITDSETGTVGGYNQDSGTGTVGGYNQDSGTDKG